MRSSTPKYEFERNGSTITRQTVVGWSWAGDRIDMGLSLAMAIHETPDLKDSLECRKTYWPKILKFLPERPRDLRKGGTAKLAWVDYVRPWKQRARINARSLKLFMAHDGKCLIAGMKVADPQPEDDALFKRFVDGARILQPGQAPAAR